MDVVTNTVPATGTTVTVTRGTHGTKAETHASGRTVYVGRPNLFQGYDVAGSCTNGTGLASILPWINTTNGKRYNCYSGGEWFQDRAGLFGGGGHHYAKRLLYRASRLWRELEYLNDTACSSATTATASYVVTAAGEIANLRVRSSATETQAAGDTVTVYKNGSAHDPYLHDSADDSRRLQRLRRTLSRSLRAITFSFRTSQQRLELRLTSRQQSGCTGSKNPTSKGLDVTV